MIRRTLVVVAMVVAFGFGLAVGTHTASPPDCPEDAALLWNGTTNAHTDCITVDSIDTHG